MHIHAYTRTVNKAIYIQYVHTIKMLECITQTTTYCMHKYITYIHTYVQYNATDTYYIHMVAMVTGYMYIHIYFVYIDASTAYIRMYMCNTTSISVNLCRYIHTT